MKLIPIRFPRKIPSKDMKMKGKDVPKTVYDFTDAIYYQIHWQIRNFVTLKLRHDCNR